MRPIPSTHTELNQSLPRYVRPKLDFIIVIALVTLLPTAVCFYPAIVVINGINKPPSSGSLELLMLSIPLFFIAMLANILWEYFRERSLLRWGSVAKAEIIVGPEYAAGRGGRYMDVQYDFDDKDGNNVSGVRRVPSKYLKPASVQETWKDLEHAVVIYNAKNSERNMLYPGVYLTCFLPKRVKH